jgi:hypothetical protein
MARRLRDALARAAARGGGAVGYVLAQARRHQDALLVLALLAGIGIMVVHWVR